MTGNDCFRGSLAVRHELAKPTDADEKLPADRWQQLPDARRFPRESSLCSARLDEHPRSVLASNCRRQVPHAAARIDVGVLRPARHYGAVDEARAVTLQGKQISARIVGPPAVNHRANHRGADDTRAIPSDARRDHASPPPARCWRVAGGAGAGDLRPADGEGGDFHSNGRTHRGSRTLSLPTLPNAGIGDYRAHEVLGQPAYGKCQP